MTYTLCIVQLPGKNILILGAVCLSIIVGAGAYKIAQASRSKADISASNGIIANVNADGSINSTNPSDKLQSALEEIQNNSVLDASSTNPFAPAADDTLTARLSKNFFSSYVQVQTADNDGTASQDPTSDAALVDNALGTVDTSTLPKDKYVESDMSVVAGGTADELRAYAVNVANIQNEELTLIKQDPSTYENDLNAIGGIYSSIAAKLIKIPVPVAFAADHLSIVNAYYVSSEDFKLINDQTKDPLKSLLGLRQYRDTIDKQRAMFTDIATQLNSSGILFNETDPGYFWTALIVDASSSSSQ